MFLCVICVKNLLGVKIMHYLRYKIICLTCLKFEVEPFDTRKKVLQGKIWRSRMVE